MANKYVKITSFDFNVTFIFDYGRAWPAANNWKLLTLDCCPADTVGTVTFKGVYKYSQSLASTVPVHIPCVYNSNTNSSRLCTQNLQVGPQWREIDSSQCTTQSEGTQKLLDLETVKYDLLNRSAYYYIVCYYFFKNNYVVKVFNLLTRCKCFWPYSVTYKLWLDENGTLIFEDIKKSFFNFQLFLRPVLNISCLDGWLERYCLISNWS